MCAQAISYSVRDFSSKLLLARLFFPALLLCSALALVSCGGGGGGGSGGDTAPVASGPGTVQLPIGCSGTFVLTGTDAEDAETALTVEVTVAPANGALDAAGGAAPLSVTYIPAVAFVGTDQLQFTVSDTAGNASPAVTVLLEVAIGPDTDCDGLNDSVELTHGYDPLDADMDDDGLLDGQEDVDGDGLADAGETDPLAPDTDGDGFCDGPRADNDGDGILPVDACAGQEMLFVAGSAAGAADGTSWGDAFSTVQAGVDAALAGQQVWVAAGVYSAAAPTATVLAMKAGVEIYGGFAGTEGARAQRPAPLLVSTLSGDVNGDDIPGDLISNKADNSLHVVEGASDAVLDGFKVSGGNAVGFFPDFFPDNAGGGMLNSAVTGLTLSNLVFSGNSADNGGGMLNDASSAALTDVTFSGNSAVINGGGMHNFQSLAILTNAAFSGNSAVNSVGTRGGGMFNVQSLAILTNVAFSGNSAADTGGGMFNQGSSAELTDVTFSGNSAGTRGGGMLNDGSSAALTDVAFSGNTAHSGGGMANEFVSSPVLSGVTFSGNSAAGHGGGMYNQISSSPILSNVSFSGNSAGASGGGMFNKGSSTALTDVTFSGNSAGASGGGMFNELYSGALTDVTFSGNSALNGGGMLNALGSSPVLSNAAFSGNSAVNNGGGMYNGASSPKLSNAAFSSNTAGANGGGMFNFQSVPVLTNAAFSGNSASFGGGIHIEFDSTAHLFNAAFWGNTGTGPDVVLGANGTNAAMVDNTCSQQDLAITALIFVTSSVTLLADPFVAGPNGAVFLNQTGGCVDIGDDAAADAVGLDWRSLTTALDGALDAPPVDAGAHYHPARVQIAAFAADATQLSWSASGADGCVITNDQDGAVIVVDPAQLASGSVAHGLPAGAVATMSCFGAGMPVVEQAIVP